ncbi:MULTISPECIES: right-handed parallel beta-helix repeat-containing protein [unclassified Crossiella]|uniref:right-handed parallel beta-helix repeat-containing protein n=1 Tax=unclassified Crossiella TaxID=2620835 RepID=UPI001FFE9496|nr:MULTISPECIES: right-handed parallel beta-helix repeat-containing protein [unclassified Crossiella]MCK2243649.1 right-handed parallel beta-helix repeat-containing protein [Crossiella sp. S99.2]MCK2257507.1 right-handed parallel beta-helix repeat-containing protein [Crossiella sp. S99.1]
MADEAVPLRLYAKPGGVTTGDCAQPSTACGLDRVLARQRELTPTMTRDLVVYFDGGRYQSTQPRTLGAADSGKNGHRVIWRNLPGESPVLSAGVPITGWTKDQDGLWRADAKGLDFLQLYGLGKRFTRARTPNTGFVPSRLMLVKGQQALRISIPGAALPDGDLGGLDGAHAVVQFTWRQLRYRIDAVSAAQDGFRQVVPKSPEGITNPTGTGGTLKVALETKEWVTGQRYATFFEGAKEFLDADNEWWLDRKANRVYLKSAQDPSTLGIVAPVGQQVLRLDGASDIQFHGLQFAHTSWLLPNQQGNLQRQGGVHFEAVPPGKTSAGFPVWEVNPGAVHIENSRNISFTRNAFRHLGATGVVLGPGTNQVSFDSNVFTKIADSGIFIGTPQDPAVPEQAQNRGTTVRNNYFDDLGLDYHTDSAVTATYPNGLAIEHNTITNVRNIGINLGWTHNLELNQVSALRDVRVRDNRLERNCLVAIDCGAIHTKANFHYAAGVPRSTISGNYITQVNRQPTAVGSTKVAAIYLDDRTNRLLVERNQFDSVDEGVYSPNPIGQDNTIEREPTGGQQVKDNAGLPPANKWLTTFDFARDSIGGKAGPYPDPA